MTEGLNNTGGASKTAMVGSTGVGESSPTGGAAVTSTVMALPIAVTSISAGWAGITLHSMVTVLIMSSLSGLVLL